MPQELNKIWNAGKLFEPKPESEQPAKQPESEPNPSTVKRKKSVIGAFMDKQEDPFKERVEAVLKGIEPAPVLSEPKDSGGEEEKPVPFNAVVIIGKGQDEIGKEFAAGKSIYVEGYTGDWTGSHMSGGKIHVKGHARHRLGDSMSGGEIYVEGNVGRRTGYYMSGGKIQVKGSAGLWTGDSMYGGTLRIDGDVASFGKTAFFRDNKGTIIWKGETIWQDGKKVEPGWTKLKVEEKVEEKIIW